MAVLEGSAPVDAGLPSPLRDRMIFIVGAQRSGTNWVERLVTVHPRVATVGTETHLFSHGLAPLVERFHHGAAESPRVGAVYVDRTTLIGAIRDFCDTVFLPHLGAAPAGADRLVERTPVHAFHLDLIGEVYPDAAVLHVVRDGRDVAASLVAQPWGPRTLTEAAIEWSRAVEAVWASRDRLNRFVEIRYEDLLADTRATLSRLYEALGLEADDAVLDAALAEASVWFNVEPTRPVVAEGKWAGTLSPRDLREVTAVAGAALNRAGYACAPAGPPRGGTGGVLTGARRRGRSALGRRAATASRRSTGRVAREVIDTMTAAQPVVDALLGALAARDRAALEALLAPDAALRVGGRPGGAFERGDAARTRLLARLVRDPALEGRLVASDVFTGVPTCGVVLTYRLADGGQVDRTLVVGVRDGFVTRLGWYGGA